MNCFCASFLASFVIICYGKDMQKILRAIAFESFALYILSQLFTGVVVKDGIQGILISGGAIAVASFLLKPVLN